MQYQLPHHLQNLPPNPLQQLPQQLQQQMPMPPVMPNQYQMQQMLQAMDREINIANTNWMNANNALLAAWQRAGQLGMIYDRTADGTLRPLSPDEINAKQQKMMQQSQKQHSNTATNNQQVTNKQDDLAPIIQRLNNQDQILQMIAQRLGMLQQPTEQSTPSGQTTSN